MLSANPAVATPPTKGTMPEQPANDMAPAPSIAASSVASEEPHFSVSPAFADDERVKWIGRKVLTAFKLNNQKAEGSTNLFLDALHRNGGRNLGLLSEFLEGRTSSQALLWYKEISQQKIEVVRESIVEVEQEPEIEQQMQAITIEATDLTADESLKSAGPSETEKTIVESEEEPKPPKRRQSARGSIAISSPSRPTSSRQSIAPVPPAAPKRSEASHQSHRKITTTTTETVVTVKLHMCLEHFPEGEIDKSADGISMYFLRNTGKGETVMTPENEDAAEALLCHVFEYGVLPGHHLVMLQQLLTEVYLPLLTSMDATETTTQPLSGAASAAIGSTVAGSQAFGSVMSISTSSGREANQANLIEEAIPGEAFNSEFIINMQKFTSQIAHTIQQVSGDVRLRIPEIYITSVEEAINDKVVVSTLEKAAEEWIETIVAILEKELKRATVGKGPVVEIEFWRDRNSSLSTLYEQLNLPIVRKMLEVLKRIETPVSNNLDFQLAELTKFYTEAKDNVKFLSTLERHFKNITIGSLISVQDSLPSMMNAIRMVWIISRHYNRDERMVPLMERIAWELAHKVSSVVNVRQILREPPSDAKKKILDAKNLLEAWSKTYFQVRERIEQSGRDQRWEFDRKRLFERTNYMAARCGDLYEVAEVMEQFYNIFGPELKAVTGDPQQIDEVIKRVEALSLPIERVQFDPFDKKHQPGWEIVMSKFREQIVQIEEMAKQFIDASFKKLRSAEGAFDLLQNIKNIKSREAINSQMMKKFNEILIQYSKEVDIIDDLFKNNK